MGGKDLNGGKSEGGGTRGGITYERVGVWEGGEGGEGGDGRGYIMHRMTAMWPISGVELCRNVGS